VRNVEELYRLEDNIGGVQRNIFVQRCPIPIKELRYLYNFSVDR